MARSTDARTHTPSPAAPGEAVLDAERLDCYHVARQLHLLIMAFPLKGAIRDQMERASLSIVLNVAEGCGRVRGERSRHFSIARGSAMEVAAGIDIALLRGVITAPDARKARGLAVRCVQMLSRLQAVAESTR
jgi:four helix bundle protein